MQAETRVERQEVINGERQERYDAEKAVSEELTFKMRQQRNHMDDIERDIRDLKDDKSRLIEELERAREEATRLRRVKEGNDAERRGLEREVSGLNQLCEVRMRANESLGRELQQMAEDDEVIRQRLDRTNRIVTLKNRNEGQIQESLKAVEKSKSPIRRRHDVQILE